MKHPFPARALALALAPVAALAQAASDNPLEEIVVISSRVPMPLREVGTAISVIDEEEITRRGFNSLAEILRTQPSVAASNTGGPGKATALRIRGEEGFRTKVLVDGIDITDTSGTQFSPRMEQFLSSGIQRVEILRGPQGLMYGADAGGVINITTLTPRDGLGGRLAAEAGSFGTREFSGSVGGDLGAVDFLLGIADFRTDGFNSRSTDTDLRDDDGYENSTYNGRLGWDVTDTLRLSVAGRRSEGENEYDNCFTVDTFASSNDCTDDFSQDAVRVAADYNGQQFTHQLAFSENRTEKDFFTEGRRSFGADGELSRWSYVGSWRSGEVLRLVYGLDRETQAIDDGSFDRDRDQTGIYGEVQGRFADGITVTAGARNDDNDDYGSFTSYRVSGAWVTALAGGELKLRGTWGTGFRAPSLYEISYNRGPFAFPPAATADLEEETSEGYDLGVAWAGERGQYLELTWFEQQVEDQIFFDLVGFSGYLQEDGESESRGVELAASWPLAAGFTVDGNYTWNDAETATGEQRARRPEHLGNLGFTFTGRDERLKLGAHLRLSRDAVSTAATPLDDYEVVDLNASFELFPGLTLFGRIENALDEDYEEVPTYNTAERAAYAGLRYRF
ncbi:TonB-dependent receptor [Pseudohaliea sp.]|uniref:TonB-dependent receptor plug domain-containing protein n=1 Tax=Pseudohaliea sp. TaxID=2740289 RepID=UPI0032ECCF91